VKQVANFTRKTLSKISSIPSKNQKSKQKSTSKAKLFAKNKEGFLPYKIEFCIQFINFF
jgi:hypothetical protein